MKNFVLTTVTVFLFLISCNNNTIGKYKKEPLPEGFFYNIIEDNSNNALEKNQLTVEINQKITEGQIATLAEELFNSKPKQRRFFIFIQLQKTSGAWAISHFDPELEIQILGSTSQQEENAKANVVEENNYEIVGKWREERYTSSNYIIFKKDSKIFIRTIYINGQTSDEELKEKKNNYGIRFDYKGGGKNGEYFILNNDGNLEFYNSENKNFTIAMKMK